jgi:hypothetical protein
MQRYEYKVVPAPTKGEKARGAKTTPDRFAYKLTTMMNDLARDGWDYVRADTLPCEERSGLTGKVTTYQNMLVFRRPVAQARALPIFDETTVPPELLAGASVSGSLRGAISGPVLAPGLIKSATAPLTPNAPEGKTPRITAFARVEKPLSATDGGTDSANDAADPGSDPKKTATPD